MSVTLPEGTGACALPDTPLAKAGAGLDLCVHCGFCLQACPTYLALENENDSPRGRIVLMRGLLEGDLSPDDSAVAMHLDRCLGCRGCESACPSGVPYGHLQEAPRATLVARRPLPLAARLVLGVFRRQPLLRMALALGRLARGLRLSALLGRLPGRLGFPFAMLESTRRRFVHPPYHPSSSDDAGSFAILTGCVMEGLYAPTNRATERVLLANGYRQCAAPGQGCCGALHAHAGDAESARGLARRNIAAFERSGADVVAVNAAGCGAMMKEYGHLLADDPDWSSRAAALAARVRDVSELLAARGPRPGGPLAEALTVAYDAPCHLLHAQRVLTAPLAVLQAIPGLTLVPLADSEHCCGSAGIYNLVEPDVSDAVLQPKLANIQASGAAIVATGNPGCLMQIGAGLARRGARARAVHPVDLLDASYAAQGSTPTAPPAR
jgi:glycolate oxidase iron-sulfur subunit